MSRVNRHRTMSLGSTGTKDHVVSNSILPTSHSSIPALFTKSCDDFVGRPIIDGSLNIIEIDYSGYVPANGIHRSNLDPLHTWSTYHDYVSDLHTASSHLSTAIISDADAVANLKARSNPSRPEIVPLSLIQDLYDLPRMLKDVGRLIKSPKSLLSPKEIANQHLGAQFGWLPLVDDVHKLLNVQSLIHRRMGEIDRLFNGSGLRRSLHLDSKSATSSSTFTDFSEGTEVAHFTKDVYTVVDKWGTIRWKPRSSPGYNPSDKPTIQDIRRAVSGLTPEGLIKGAWDLLPWSWIVNWFTNAHTLAMGYSNFIPADSSHICLMTESTTTTIYRSSDLASLGVSGGTGSVTRTTKSRGANVSPSLTAHLPFLDGGRLGVLGSLFVQRFK